MVLRRDEQWADLLRGLGKLERKRLQPQQPKPSKVQWDSAGSYKDEDDIWRGGVAMGSYASADARAAGTLQDCRGWGRYMGRIYVGKGGATMVAGGASGVRLRVPVQQFGLGLEIAGHGHRMQRKSCA